MTALRLRQGPVAGYDSERTHRLLRYDLGFRSIIPPKIGDENGTGRRKRDRYVYCAFIAITRAFAVIGQEGVGEQAHAGVEIKATGKDGLKRMVVGVIIENGHAVDIAIEHLPDVATGRGSGGARHGEF